MFYHNRWGWWRELGVRGWCEPNWGKPLAPSHWSWGEDLFAWLWATKLWERTTCCNSGPLISFLTHFKNTYTVGFFFRWEGSLSVGEWWFWLWNDDSYWVIYFLRECLNCCSMRMQVPVLGFRLYPFQDVWRLNVLALLHQCIPYLGWHDGGDREPGQQHRPPCRPSPLWPLSKSK